MQHGIKYSQFVHSLGISNISLNRKMLAELAVNEPYSFAALTDQMKVKLGASWRDTNKDRLTSQYYDRFVIDDIPAEFLEKPDPNFERDANLAAIKERFAKGAAKAARTNEEYLKTGKSVKKEAVVRKWKSQGWKKQKNASE
jgi:hypothetical protein